MKDQHPGDEEERDVKHLAQKLQRAKEEYERMLNHAKWWHQNLLQPQVWETYSIEIISDVADGMQMRHFERCKCKSTTCNFGHITSQVLCSSLTPPVGASG